MAAVIKIPGAVTSPIGVLTRDLLAQYVGASNLKYSIDLSFSRGFPKQAAPVNGDLIRNLATDDTNDASFVGVTGSNPTFGGGGFSFGGLAARGALIRSPAGIAAGLSAAQRFCIGTWIKLPSLAQHTLGQAYRPWLSLVPLGGSYVGTIPALLELGFFSSGSNAAIFAGRQTGSGTSQTLTHTRPGAWPYGEVALIVAYKTASQTGLLMRTDGATTSVTSGTVTDNTLTDWSAIRMNFGPNYTDLNFGHSTYRSWIADISGTGAPAPLDILNYDWANYRGYFS